jgi:APA family basic amino acid/polyamine antiporter
MRLAMGERGAWWIATGIAVSTLGFLSQGMLTAPRVYNAMARDGLFFESVGRLSVRTGAPVTAIVLQGIAATAIAFSGKYEQILNYEVSVDFIAFALAAGALFLFRRQKRGLGQIYRTPGHPFTTALFVASCVGIVASTVITDPLNSARGWGIMLTGVPVYWYWSRRRKAR